MKAIILFTFIISFGYAQNDDIIGVSRTSNPSNQVYLAKVNEINGLVEDLSANSYSEYISNFTYTVDPDLDIFYYTGLNNLIGIDISTGNLVTDVPISTSIQPYFQNFVYNELTQELIGLERGQNGGNQVYLSKIDPQTGIVTPVSQNSITDAITLNAGSTIDLNNQWFQFVSNGQLFSVDIATGQVVHSPVIDTSQVAFFDNILFNAADGNLYGLGRNSQPAEIFLSQIDPVTGLVTLISQQSISEGFSLSGAAINPFSGIYYFKGLNEFKGVSLNSGNVVTSTPLDFSVSNGDFFDYYYYSGKVAALLNTQNLRSKQNIDIYPNPVESILTVKSDSFSTIQIFDLRGTLLSEKEVRNANTTILDMSEFARGIYILKLKSEEQSLVKKIIKK